MHSTRVPQSLTPNLAKYASQLSPSSLRKSSSASVILLSDIRVWLFESSNVKMLSRAKRTGNETGSGLEILIS